MEHNRLKIVALVCAVLLLLGWFGATALTRDESQQWEHQEGGSIILSEILPANRTCPAPDGRLLDFIEIHNLSGSPVDISGYMLGDDLSAIGYTFPEGSVISGYGYLVCWCDKDSESDRYAKFGISRTGGDTIYLYNAANVLVDEKVVPQLAGNSALIRVEDKTWQVSLQPTPGFENSDAGYEKWLRSTGIDQMQVVISEVMTSSSCTAVEGIVCDWIELTNNGNQEAVLTGAYLSDDPAEPLKWQIPALKLQPGETKVIRCGGDGQTAAPFALARSGCTVVLSGQYGNCLSSVACPVMEKDHSYAMNGDGTYAVTDLVTPGYSNDEAGRLAWLKDLGAEGMQVAITELQPNNRSTLLTGDGKLCDWLEITNLGSVPAVLDGAYLSNDPTNRGKWQIPALILQPGESKVIFCDATAAAATAASFGFAGEGGTVILSGSAGNILSKAEYPAMGPDESWALTDGEYRLTSMATPGYPNTEEGYLTCRNAQAPTGGLVITEVMSSNDAYLLQSDGGYHDWIELENRSKEAIDLSAYYLSDDPAQLELFRLPQKTLAPGERVIVICAGEASLVGKYIFADFTISAEEAWLYLSSGGKICDRLHLEQIPQGCSFGRMTGENAPVYFTAPTPGRANGTGVALISEQPVVKTEPGVYESAKVSVEVQGAGTVRYTLDGSVPGEDDPVYTAPIQLTETAVLRFAAFEAGKLPSEAITASYILGEGHTLPVVSLTAEPEALNAVMAANLGDPETPCNLQLFEADGSFSADAGVQRSGSLGAFNPKQGYQIHFRGRYDGVLGYPVFGTDGSYVYGSLLIRSGGDYDQTIFRDELFATLAQQLDGELPIQKSKFCVLYVNGQYRGIYALKEDVDVTFYSQLTGSAEKNITMTQDPALHATDLYDLAKYCGSHDLTVQEYYDYVAARLDIASFIDWLILEGYCCNSDVAGNVTWFRSTEMGDLWQPVLQDLDNGFYYRDGFQNVLNPDSPQQYTVMATALMKNETFRTLFLKRLQYALTGPLSDENVLARIDALEALLTPEISRERQLWGGSVENWKADISRLRSYLTRYDHTGMLVQSLRQTIALTDEEAKTYFGR